MKVAQGCELCVAVIIGDLRDSDWKHSSSLRMTDTLGVEKPKRLVLYYISHIDNVKSIVAHGLKSHNRAWSDHEPTDISEKCVQDERKKKSDLCHYRKLHDYVPLLFEAKGPMLSCLRCIQEELVVFAINYERVMMLDQVVFTDGNAASGGTNFYQNIDDLEKLDWDCLNDDWWTNTEDGKRKRAAEVLIPHHLPRGFITRIYVVNKVIKEMVESMVYPQPLPVEVKERMFF